MKKLIPFAIALIMSITGIGQTLFQIDSIRHPNCQSLTGHAYFSLAFYTMSPGPMLVKGQLIPGSEFQTFDAIAIINDNDNNGWEPYEFSMQTEGDVQLFFVYPALNMIDTAHFHFNSHLLNFVGMFSGLVSCDSTSLSGISFSEGTPPYYLYSTDNNWQTSSFIDTYNTTNPSIQTDVPQTLPFGQYQFKLQDKYCEKLLPEPSALFSAWGIGHSLPNSYMSTCPEITGDTLILQGSMTFTKDLEVVSGSIATYWEDTISVAVNFGDGSQPVTYYNTVKNWEIPIHISHTYTSSGIFQVQYLIKNEHAVLTNTWYAGNAMEYVNTMLVSVPETRTENNKITVYPNPVDKKLNISYYSETPGITQVQIFNIAGQLIYENNFCTQNTNNTNTINTEFLSRGSYTLRINTGTEIIRKIFVK